MNSPSPNLRIGAEKKLKKEEEGGWWFLLSRCQPLGIPFPNGTCHISISWKWLRYVTPLKFSWEFGSALVHGPPLGCMSLSSTCTVSVENDNSWLSDTYLRLFDIEKTKKRSENVGIQWILVAFMRMKENASLQHGVWPSTSADVKCPWNFLTSSSIYISIFWLHVLHKKNY